MILFYMFIQYYVLKGGPLYIAGCHGNIARFIWFEGRQRSRQNNAFAVFTNNNTVDGQPGGLANLFVQIHGRGVKNFSALFMVP